MNKQVFIISAKKLRQMIREHQIPENAAFIISTSYPVDPTVLGYFRYHGLKYIAETFMDFDSAQRGGLTDEAALRIALFIRQLDDTTEALCCVCDSGVRRSSAVGCAALRFWDREREEMALWNNASYEPNPHVFQLITNYLKTIEDAELDERLRINWNAIHNAYRKNR